MTDLTAKQESFVKTMAESDEYARHGFDLLSKRERPETFFDALAAADFFTPDKNPAPRPSTEPGFVQIPYWSALNYLEAVARRSSEMSDLVLANKVLDVVRAVSSAREPDGTIRDNYSTYWRFALILGLVPMTAVSLADVDLIPGWQTSKYNRTMVGHALSQGVVGKFLASTTAEDIDKACRMLWHCTAFDWVDDTKRTRDVATRVDDFWLKDLLKRHATAFGQKAGARSAEILANRLRQLFGDERRSYGSTVWRSAVEDSPQNYDFRTAENCFVEGLRDVLISWLDTAPGDAKVYIQAALGDAQEIIRRIAIHCVTERFDLLHDTFAGAVGSALFATGHRHELFRLLRKYFGKLTNDEKAAVVVAIRNLQPPATGDDKDVRLKRIQRDWLTALKGTDYAPAVEWLAELEADAAIGPASDHPDYLSYHQMRTGPGPAPFGEETIVASAEDGTLVERLNQFKEHNHWKGPTLGGLVEALQAAVAKCPDVFLPILAQFKGAKRPFQHALIAGFKRVFDTPKENRNFDWAVAWPKLLAFFQNLVSDAVFWDEPIPEKDVMIPDRNWIASTIADFLQAGTKSDASAYAPDLLPLGLQIIKVLLRRVTAASSASLDDPMMQALNTGKGRVVEALINHALRECRVASKRDGSTAAGWALVCDVFDAEISQCRDGNFEFSTLSASYIANIRYMSNDWLVANALAIFPMEFRSNFICALGGLPYAHTSQAIYRLLDQHDVYGRALAEKIKDSRTQERIIEWVGLAYLWGDENLDSPKLLRLFDEDRNGDIDTMCELFWHVRGDELSDVQRARILDFWSKVLDWASRKSPRPTQLLAHLSRLACYISEIDDKTKPLLLAVAPYVNREYDTDILATDLSRLVDKNPAAVAEILEQMFVQTLPTYDMEDRIRNLIKRLFELGQKPEARRIAERLRSSLPGMLELYKELTAA